MAPVFRPVARLIAAILLLQVVLAPAHCLAMAAAPAGMATVLCSPAGVERMIYVGPDGQQLPEPDTGQGVCVVCTGLPQAALPEPPNTPAPARVALGPAWQVASAVALPTGARGPPYRQTGPPALS
ncbi:hypothetical protein GXW78_22330 [Roseomonas terrae]|uniref:DUF2946 domain-containing protein n=1 Tax=Neoroseomonas terrae TaxID=424799 RepID=A0ABS5EN00_9PROT|nr:hypothetical protein [Neoroseomonas terrae]MBR0652410.1 hypothetical protein [Neoroseomonas terrae]